MTKMFRGYFITGLLVVVPLYFSYYVFSIIVNSMDGMLTFLPVSLRPDTYLPFHIPGLGIIFTVFCIFIIGLLTTNFLGKSILSLTERGMAKVPVVRMVYNATKQFMETFFNQSNQGFKKVVLIEYPRKGLWSMGFLMSRVKGEMQYKTSNEPSVCIFIPTTPNPTSGFFAVLPEKEIIPLDMKVEEAFKVIMTGGMVVPTNEEFKTYIPKSKDLVNR